MKKNKTFEKGNIPKATLSLMYFVNGTLTLLLINRWIVSGHFPLSNLYESLIFLSWSFATIYSITSFTLPSTILPVLGSSIAPITLLTSAFAFFCVPQELQKAQSLVPALQSNWLIMHVSVMILSYASLLLGSLFALTLLLTKRISKQNLKRFKELFFYSFVFTPSPKVITQGVNDKEYVLLSETKGFAPSDSLITKGDGMLSGPESKNSVKFHSVETNLKNSNLLDNISYRFIGLGFALLTLGIISGAVWANFAWGSYWSWDPKETWAFITWLTYAFYLHLRISKGWYGEQSAFVAIFGFFVVWFCYLGVNLFGKGLHSYAFV